MRVTKAALDPVLFSVLHRMSLLVIIVRILILLGACRAHLLSLLLVEVAVLLGLRELRRRAEAL